MHRYAFIAVVTALAWQHAAAVVIFDCTNGIRSDISTKLSTDNLATFAETSGFVCEATDLYELDTNGGNSASALVATGPGATAGVGIGFFETSQTVEARANATVMLEFYIRKTDPFANDILTMDFDMEVLTIHSTLIASQPVTVSRSGRGFISIFDERPNGFPQGPKNDIDEQMVFAGIAPGALATLSGDVIMHADRLSAVMLQAIVTARGSASTIVFPDGSDQEGFGTASLGIGVSAGLHLPPGYEFEFLTANVPQAGLFPNIDSPLAAIPVPPALLLLGSALCSLIALGRRRDTG